MNDLAELVSLSHEAKLYDIDLHALNVMVADMPEGRSCSISIRSRTRSDRRTRSSGWY
jgi:hypothetical protein